VKSAKSYSARIRLINFTLSEALVSQAREVTPNLSGAVERLLVDYVIKQNSVRRETAKNSDKATRAWNRFNVKHGSFADEHSTL
jgi:antitoxin CcdA